MEKYIWIIQVLLAMFFMLPGLMKLKTSKDTLVSQGKMPANGSILFIRILGISELLGVIAMVLPIWFKELQFLTGLAAIGFAVVMIGASVVHYKKKEFKKLPLLAFVLALSIMVVINRLF